MRWQEEWDKLKKMPRREWVEYLWNNYMGQILTIFFVGLLLLLAANTWYKKTHIEDDVVIALLEQETYSSLLETDGVKVTTYPGLSSDTMEVPESGEQYMGLVAQIAAGDVDAVVSTEAMLSHMQQDQDEIFLSLTDLFTEEELKRYDAELLLLADTESNPHPVGFSLKNSLCLSQEQPEDLYIVFTCHTKKTEELQQWIRKQIVIKE